MCACVCLWSHTQHGQVQNMAEECLKWYCSLNHYLEEMFVSGCFLLKLSETETPLQFHQWVVTKLLL